MALSRKTEDSMESVLRVIQETCSRPEVLSILVIELATIANAEGFKKGVVEGWLRGVQQRQLNG